MTDLAYLLAAAAAALLVRRYVFCLTRIQGRSMLPTLRSGQWAFVSRWDYLAGRPRRGDVVICFFPGRMMKRLPFLRQLMVKRVVGLPGETVAFEEGSVLIDGQALREDYLGPQARRPLTRPPVLLGEDEYFVLGDNRDASRDSRAVGPLNRRMIVGRVRFLLPFRPLR
ncbi:MAG: signal peptidase I [Christensenellaceae bacterium]|nr:signal peptidase I [Christensenellaceae bacterium]